VSGGHMIDTIRLYKSGREGVDFKLNQGMFRKDLNISGEVELLKNSFEMSNGSKVVVFAGEMKKGLVVEFSVPKLVYGHSLKNFSLLDRDELIGKLYSGLNGIVEVDFENMKVSRLDVSLNLTTSYDVGRYVNCLSSLYVRKRNYQTFFVENESFTIYNKSRRIIFYDKVLEHKKEGLIDKGAKISHNILRFEIQNKTTRAIKNFSGSVYTLSSLLQEKEFSTLLSLKKGWFKNEFLNSKSLYETDLNLIGALELEFKGNIIDKFLIKRILESGSYSLEYLSKLMLDNGYSKRQVRRKVKEYRNLREFANSLNYSLVNEIYSKIDLSLVA